MLGKSGKKKVVSYSTIGIVVLVLILIAIISFAPSETTLKARNTGTSGETAEVDNSDDTTSTPDPTEEAEANEVDTKNIDSEQTTHEPEVLAPPEEFTQDLSFTSYPKALFKQDSEVLDGFIVISKNASNEVREAAIDLNSQLVPIEKTTSDALEIGVDYAARDEWPGVSCKDMPMLCIGPAANFYNRYSYTETLFTPRGRVEYRVDPNDDDRVPRPYFYVNQQNQTYRYKVTFLPALESQHNTGKLQSTTYPDVELILFGKEYIMIDANHPRQNDVSLTIVGGMKDYLVEGEERVYEIDGELVTIKVVLINQNQVLFHVNGERVKPMNDDEARLLPMARNRSIAVHEILENEATEAVGQDVVEFYFGDLWVIRDANTSSPSTINEKGEFVGSSVVVNKEQLPQVDVSIVTTTDEGVTNGDTVRTKSIEFKYVSSDDIYGWGKLSEIADRVEHEPGNFLNLFEIEYKGLTSNNDEQYVEEYVFHPSGEDGYKLKWQNNAGHWYDQEIVSCTTDTCGTIAYGRKSGSNFYDLVVDETEPISEDEFFFLKSEDWPYLMQFDSINNNSKIVTIRDVYRSEKNEPMQTFEISYDSSSRIGYFDHAESVFTFNISPNGQNITVDMNGDGDFADTSIALRAKSGGDFVFSNATEPLFQYKTNELIEDTRRDEINMTVYWHPEKKKLDINSSSGISGDWLFGFNSTLSNVILNRSIELNNTDVEMGMTEFGLRGELTEADSTNQSIFTIFAPKYQEFGYLEVYPKTFKKLVRVAERLGSGTGTDAGHVIVVGGPCENKITAELIGFVDDDRSRCDMGLAPGEGMIQLLPEKRSGKHVIVVAGNGNTGTLNALTVLKDPAKYKLGDQKGSKVVVRSEKGVIHLS